MQIVGVYPPIATPFDERGGLNRGALADNVARWNDTGLDGYVVAGSNGESVLLTDDEVVQAVRTVRDAALDDMRVIAGTGRQSTAATIRLTNLVADAGASVALVMNPYFFSGQLDSAALERHYEAVADASSIPILVYNVPKFTHLNVSASVIANLAGHERIIGVKDSAGDIAQIIDLVRLCPAGFSILVGNGPAFLSGLQVGASGGVLALANAAPRECVQVYKSVQQGRDAVAREIHLRMMPVGRAVTADYGVPGLKAALDLLGYYGGAPRAPLLSLGGEQRRALAGILREAGLLSD